jgi:predicted TIM-barrel fold metal-dependent hydrolase
MPTIDSDAHVIETDRTWEYAEPAERKLMPRPISDGGKNYWLVEDRLYDRRRNVGTDTSVDSQELLDISARLRHMDELEIDVQVIYPTLFLIPVAKRPDVELALNRSYNRWMADISERSRGRLRWAVVVPWLTIPEAIAEARYGKEHGACAVFMRGLETERLATDPYLFPVYEEASRLNMPVCIHAGNGSFAHQEFYGADPLSKFKLPVVGAFHSLVFQRITERFPDLRFGFVEATAQWVPWQVKYLTQRLAQENRAPRGNLLRDNRLYVTTELVDDLQYVLQYAGEDNLVIGTDYGHGDTSAAIEALRALKQQGTVEPAAIQKILDDNARALYAL